MAQNQIGAKRHVVGAHYGLRDWLGQRITAVIMAVYTVIALFCYLTADELGFDGWRSFFQNDFFAVMTLLAFLAVFYHAWIGIRDIWMDYVKPVGVRLALQALTIVWLLGCAIYAAKILWGV